MNYYLIENNPIVFVKFTILENRRLSPEAKFYNHLYMNSHAFSKESEIEKSLLKMDFFKTITGKMPENIYNMGDGLDRGFIINKKLYDKMQHFNWAPHIANPIEFVYRKKTNSNYHYIYFLNNCIKYSDWENTIFRDGDYNEFRLKSISDLENEKNKRNVIFIKKCVLSSEFPSYDIFGLFLLEIDSYFSERVKHFFEENKIKNIDFLTPKTEIIFNQQ